MSFISKDIIILGFTKPTIYNKIYIINIYNKIVTITLSNLGEAISRLGSYNKLLILRDFNLYYPL